MTRSSLPHTLHQLIENGLGRRMGTTELVRAGKDRRLTGAEVKGLRAMRSRRAAEQRAQRPATGRQPVAFYANALRRFERWARSAERRGLDKGHPPHHIAEKAHAVTNMVATEAGR